MIKMLILHFLWQHFIILLYAQDNFFLCIVKIIVYIPKYKFKNIMFYYLHRP